MSRKELAELIVVTPLQIVKSENGQNWVSLGRLSLIANKFKKRVFYVIYKSWVY